MSVVDVFCCLIACGKQIDVDGLVCVLIFLYAIQMCMYDLE